MIFERTTDLGPAVVRHLESGSGSPLVLLHAFPLSADMWRPQLERPPDGWRLLAPDLKGLGPNAKAPAASIDDMAATVLQWLDAISVERAVIGGLSMGGYVTLAILRHAPSRFDGIVLANTRAGADSADGRAARDRMSALVREQGPPAVATEMLPKLVGATTHRSRLHVVRIVRDLIERNTTAGIDGAIKAMKDRPDSTPLLPGVACPALVIAGDEDVLIPPAEAEAMAGVLPDARLVKIPASGHLASLETPGEFSAALAGFAAAVAGRRRS